MSTLFTAEKLHFLSFQIRNGAINSPLVFDSEYVESHSFQVGFDLDFDKEENTVKADLLINVSTVSNGKNEEEASGSFHIMAFYHIENLEQLISGDDSQELNVDRAMASNLAAITFSTARGIIYTRFQGTALRNFILPIVDPQDLLSSPSEDK